jgi:hypothetical protein
MEPGNDRKPNKTNSAPRRFARTAARTFGRNGARVSIGGFAAMLAVWNGGRNITKRILTNNRQRHAMLAGNP